jgi:hypothetical protein
MTTIDPARLRELSARADRDDLIYGPDRDVLARRAAAKALRWRCVETGQRFRFAVDAAKLFGVSPSAISMSRSKGHAIGGRYHFVRDEPIAPRKCRGPVRNLSTQGVYRNIMAAAIEMARGGSVKAAFQAISRAVNKGREAFGARWALVARASALETA